MNYRFSGAVKSVMSSSDNERTSEVVERPARPIGQGREQLIVGAAFLVPAVLVMAVWLYLLGKLVAMIYDWLF